MKVMSIQPRYGLSWLSNDLKKLHTATEQQPKRISKRGSMVNVRGGCYNYRFKLYKGLNVSTKTAVANLSWQKL